MSNLGRNKCGVIDRKLTTFLTEIVANFVTLGLILTRLAYVFSVSFVCLSLLVDRTSAARGGSLKFKLPTLGLEIGTPKDDSLTKLFDTFTFAKGLLMLVASVPRHKLLEAFSTSEVFFVFKNRLYVLCGVFAMSMFSESLLTLKILYVFMDHF